MAKRIAHRSIDISAENIATPADRSGMSKWVAVIAFLAEVKKGRLLLAS
jgi:hypothetical protein